MKVKNVTTVETLLRLLIGQGDYVGIRVKPSGCKVYAPDGEPLPWRLDLRNHSPTGFEWGSFGSGPAQLSLAILTHYLKDKEEAQALYQEFKRKVVGRLPHAGWALSPHTIDAALEEMRDGRGGEEFE